MGEIMEANISEDWEHYWRGIERWMEKHRRIEEALRNGMYWRVEFERGGDKEIVYFIGGGRCPYWGTRECAFQCAVELDRVCGCASHAIAYSKDIYGRKIPIDGVCISYECITYVECSDP